MSLAMHLLPSLLAESNILSGVMKETTFASLQNKEFQCEDKGFGEDEDVDVVVRPERI